MSSNLSTLFNGANMTPATFASRFPGLMAALQTSTGSEKNNFAQPTSLPTVLVQTIPNARGCFQQRLLSKGSMQHDRSMHLMPPLQQRRASSTATLCRCLSALYSLCYYLALAAPLIVQVQRHQNWSPTTRWRLRKAAKIVSAAQ